jgi:signal transduction histidine kinase
MRRIKKGDEPLGEGEYQVGPRTIHWLNLPVMAGALPLGRLLALRDVTEERLLEKMRNDLTHTMVHDLRNPLTAISTSLQLLDMTTSDTLSPDQQQMMASARSGAQRMLKLTNAILDISRLEGKQMPLERALVSLRDLTTSVLNSQATLAENKRLRLESDAPSDLPPAWIDARLIERVFQNLIDNAIKFTPDGGAVCVTLRVEPAEQLAQFHISISDTGPGIAPEIRERLFQKFVTGRHEKRGSGLGLAFCKMVVEAHGGRIWVEETSGSGATFTFTLPLPPASEL